MPKKLFFRAHSVRRMAERGISVADVQYVLASGEMIVSYPSDTPYPSRLMLGFAAGRPLHVVAADDEASGITFVITVYEPSSDVWDETYRRRKR
jgi:Domain of unknown function (DUF4258)